MYSKSAFSKTPFNRSGSSEQSLYATVTSAYGVEVQGVKILARIDVVTMNASFSGAIETLRLYVPLPGVESGAEYEITARLTALFPLSEVTLKAEAGVSARLAGLIPFGLTGLAAEYNVQLLLWARLPVREVALRSESGMSARLGVLVPLDRLTPCMEFCLRGVLWARLPLPDTGLSSEFGTSVKAVRTSESEEMLLSGLNLAPGQMLIIDTDTLEIEVDGVVRVDCWVTGGSFFQFKNGQNELSFSDNATARNLRVTVLWADRYL